MLLFFPNDGLVSTMLNRSPGSLASLSTPLRMGLLRVSGGRIGGGLRAI
ncbi:MAG: hypothetical protein ABIP55_01690 [Tepidisphaeraceae bacterium]